MSTQAPATAHETRALDQPAPRPRDPESLEGLDRVIAAYAADVDETILIENLRLSPQERFDKFVRFMRFVHAARGAARRAETVAKDPAPPPPPVDGPLETHGRA